MRPDVAVAFDRMAAAARSEARLSLLVTSGYRSDAEEAKLFAATHASIVFRSIEANS
jgi:LAS superfamily LD-carboxypeptidase LdcB